MLSMTGFGSIEKSTDQFTFSIELKSLNSKFLEIYTNLPRLLRNDETSLAKILKDNFNRGKLELSIDIYEWNEARPVHIDGEMLKRYYSEIMSTASSMKIDADVSLDALITLEGVVQRERSILSEKARNDIYTSLEKVIHKTIEMRTKEGRAIKKDLQHSLAIIADDVKKISKMAGEIAKNQYIRLRSTLESLVNARVDETRLYTEAAILADKQDINEEISRLRDHIKKFKSMMGESGQVGKQLDFLAQEMFREINTIGAKSNNSQISHLVVEMKNHIDKIREQCRNVV
jgi:uncharacterized protein (TIGR00255 family)